MGAGVKGILRGGKEDAESAEAAGRQEQGVREGMDSDFTSEELREFLDADTLDVEADPDFKERLRRKLWDMVRSRFGGGSGQD